MREIDNMYWHLCQVVLNGAHIGNTREARNVCVTLHDITDNIVGIRDISPCYLLGEWLWYFTGRNDVEFISAFGSMWKRLSDDGKTNNSAYGYLMQKAFGFNQIEKVVELLKKDPSSRRAVINLNTPNERVIETKDEPCTIALQFCIRDGKLHCTAVMRSNDIFLGFPYDVAFFTELQKFIADKLDVEYGFYTHFATSLHVYDRDVEKLEAIVKTPTLKRFNIDRMMFHEHKDKITTLIDSKIKQDDYTKDEFMEIFEQYGIYTEG